MKQIIKLFCCAAALVTGLAGCVPKNEEPMKIVDLRYRAMDTYELPATRAEAFTILVASTDPWTITSEHPEWCYITEEEGDASDPDAVHEGRAEATTIRVQYYDNLKLDDRQDKLTIKSDYWVGKVITVNQKGIAYLKISEEDQNQDVEKAGGEYTIHINANQDWSAKVTEGEWLSITDGASGTLDGDITLQAIDNPTEQRYASVTVYDRHGEPMYVVRFTQDGIQLDLANPELRTDYNQETASAKIVSNGKWTVAKASAADDWFTLDTTSGEGDGTIQITLTQNDEDAVRAAEIVVKSVVEHEGDYQAEKTLTLKQAYKVTPTRYILDNEEMSLWKSDQTNAPVYTKGVGTFFKYPCRLNRGDMPMGTYTFRWTDIQTTPDASLARARAWFCFSESAELKCDLRPFEDGGKVTFDFNAAGDGNKPSVSSIPDVDFSQPVEFTVKFEPNNVFDETGEKEYCHVQFYVNGVPGSSFDTAPDLFRTCYWGAKINLYFGMYNSGSAVCEWYEYSKPIDWD